MARKIGGIIFPSCLLFFVAIFSFVALFCCEVCGGKVLVVAGEHCGVRTKFH